MNKTALVLVFGVIYTVCLAAPQYGGEHEEYGGQHEVPIHEVHEAVHHKPIHIPIIQSKHEQHKEGYQFSYKTGNGIHMEESGYLKKDLHPHPSEHPGPEDNHPAVVMHGKISYTGADGLPITLTYVADEHGFQAQGAHLPTPPPLPLELQKAYELHNSHHAQAAQAAQAAHASHGGQEQNVEYQEEYAGAGYSYH